MATTDGRYRVSWDFRKAVPKPFGPRLTRIFGEDNTGAVVTAPDMASAIRIVATANRLNGFYLKAEILPDC